jgi:predicted  nucleic acid-binding Zn ribbon protein
MTFQCQIGHIFTVPGKRIYEDRAWCPICKKLEKQNQTATPVELPAEEILRRKNVLADLHEITEELGYQIEHSANLTNYLLLLCCCGHGHRFSLSEQKIRANVGCPTCEQNADLNQAISELFKLRES